MFRGNEPTEIRPIRVLSALRTKGAVRGAILGRPVCAVPSLGSKVRLRRGYRKADAVLT
jgi:hypothetical protein